MHQTILLISHYLPLAIRKLSVTRVICQSRWVARLGMELWSLWLQDPGSLPFPPLSPHSMGQQLLSNPGRKTQQRWTSFWVVYEAKKLKGNLNRKDSITQIGWLLSVTTPTKRSYGKVEVSEYKKQGGGIVVSVNWLTQKYVLLGRFLLYFLKLLKCKTEI